MCIINGEVQKAKRDIVVYKVLSENGGTIFRDNKGNEFAQQRIDEIEMKDFDEVIQSKAVGFEKGFGFTVFKEWALADKYKAFVVPGIHRNLQIKEYKIPKHSSYMKGIIDHSYWGGGMKAIRCEKLIPIARRT